MRTNGARSTQALSPEELAAWRGMLVAHAAAIRALDAEMLAAHGITLPAYEVLMFLADQPDRRLRMSDLAQQVLLSRSGCTRLVDRLQKLGYVTRCSADTDGRGLYAELAETGLTLLKAARDTHHAGVRRHFLDHLTPTDQIVLADIWSRCNSHP
jgi:DNA-binding MarR family transcriptional regulator